jgi:hypothetical protein
MLQHPFATLRLPRPVDLITRHFDSLNYLLTVGDLLRALRRFHANLRPGGHLIFDMITDHPPWHGPRPHVERVAWPGTAFVRVTQWDSQRGIQTARISISRNGHKYREIHVQRGYSVSTVLAALAQAQFAFLGAHDFQTLGPTTALTSRALYVARGA